MMQPKPVARVVDAFGKVEKKQPTGTTWSPLSVGDMLPEATTLRTGSGGAALIKLPAGHLVRVGEKTTVVLSQLGGENQYSLKVLSGQIWSLVKKANQPSRFSVETPSAVAGVTGTLFCVAVDPDDAETTVSTDEGSVEVRAVDETEQRPVAVRAGYLTRFPNRAHRRPAPRIGLFGPPAAMRQSPEHIQMWRTLHGEGAWARQDGRGPLQMRRGMEGRLFRFLRAHRPPVPPDPSKRRGPLGR